MVSAFGLHRLAFGDPLAFLKGITAKPPLRGGFAGFICRDDWIRTSDPYVPNVVRYRAALHPDLVPRRGRGYIPILCPAAGGATSRSCVPPSAGLHHIPVSRLGGDKFKSYSLDHTNYGFNIFSLFFCDPEIINTRFPWLPFKIPGLSNCNDQICRNNYHLPHG